MLLHNTTVCFFPLDSSVFVVKYKVNIYLFFLYFFFHVVRYFKFVFDLHSTIKLKNKNKINLYWRNRNKYDNRFITVKSHMVMLSLFKNEYCKIAKLLRNNCFRLKNTTGHQLRTIDEHKCGKKLQPFYSFLTKTLLPTIIYKLNWFKSWSFY